MVHLPALTKTGNIRKVLEVVNGFDMNIRGLYGEGSKVSGDIYQISNKQTLGISEEETIKSLKIITDKVVEQERLARKMLGKGKVVGVSARTVEQAKKAQADGADYLGVGAMFATGTKQDAKVTSKEELKRIRAAVDIPIVAIGGIKADNVEALRETGIDGIAVVSAVIAADDIKVAAKELVIKVKELKKA